jgi:superfamily I DNA/RNA helicase
MNRVAQLADRQNAEERAVRHPFRSVIPLAEILAEVLRSGSGSKKVEDAYFRLIRRLGSELRILIEAEPEELEEAGGPVLAEAVSRMRSGNVRIQEGYDGEYGVIRVFGEDELRSFSFRRSLFQEPACEDKRSEASSPRPQVQDYSHVLKKVFRLESEVAEAVPPLFRAVGAPLAGLNPEQRDAIVHYRGPALVVAGPGTGKTRVLTQRAAYLISERGVSPDSILAVTFTNRAAEEMRERLVALLANLPAGRRPWIGTFHAFGYGVLAQHAAEVGRDPGFVLIDENDTRIILEKELGVKEEQALDLAVRISLWKQTCDWSAEPPADLRATCRDYEAYLEKHNLFDLDDLIRQTVRLLSERPEILAEYYRRLHWIMVDEYQDVNHAQYSLVRSLARGDSPNLCVIGDPDQAIYGFRGADIRFIRRFLEDYPSAAVFHLKQSYRCSRNILRAAAGVVGAEASQAPMLQGLQEGVRIQIARQPTEKAEAEFVARTIESMMGGVRFFSIDSQVAGSASGKAEYGLGDFAILFRIGRQTPALEKALNDHGIPHQTVSEAPFFRREPVQSLLDALTASLQPNNLFLQRKLKWKGCESRGWPPAAEVGQDLSVSRRIEQMARSRFESEFEGEGPARSDLRRLVEMAEEHGSDLASFLRRLKLGLSSDAYRPEIENVALLTLHAAKGLEFPCVFVVGCEEGLLPLTLFGRQSADLEEERRLLYVGMTRAKRVLFLTHAERRFLLGRTWENPRSSFLDRIEEELVEYAHARPKRKTAPPDPQLRLF